MSFVREVVAVKDSHCEHPDDEVEEPHARRISKVKAEMDGWLPA